MHNYLLLFFKSDVFDIFLVTLILSIFGDWVLNWIDLNDVFLNLRIIQLWIEIIASLVHKDFGFWFRLPLLFVISWIGIYKVGS